MASNPVLRGIVCPISNNPTCLSVEVGERGTSSAGRLILGLTIAANQGILCSEDGLAVDELYVQAVQFGRKVSKKFSNGLTYTTGLIP